MKGTKIDPARGGKNDDLVKVVDEVGNDNSTTSDPSSTIETTTNSYPPTPAPIILGTALPACGREYFIGKAKVSRSSGMTYQIETQISPGQRLRWSAKLLEEKPDAAII
jgi:hypothetical protein